MRRGTTPTHTFEIPFDVSLVDKLKIVYQQKGAEVLTKTKADCTLKGTTVSVRLTQEETLNFENGENVKIQVRILTQGGDALVSEIACVPVGVLLDNEVLK